MHIKPDRLKAEIKAHRRKNTVGKGSTTMQVIMTISSTGKLMERGTKVSSGDPVLDTIVLAAVDRAQPFAPPPKVIASTPIVWVLGFLGSPRR
jgi:protein TonB